LGRRQNVAAQRPLKSSSLAAAKGGQENALRASPRQRRAGRPCSFRARDGRGHLRQRPLGCSHSGRTNTRETIILEPFAAHDGRGGQIRTDDLYVPNVALYQAKLHPVASGGPTPPVT